MNLAELQENAIAHGFTDQFSCNETGVSSQKTSTVYKPEDLRIVYSRSVDTGTDAGDDATIYMIAAKDGTKGTIIVPSSFDTDPQKAEIIDTLRRYSS